MRGFTLIELGISIAIMVMMSVLLLYNYPEAAIRITLINNVHALAILMREAQVRGSAIDSVNSSIGGYGVNIYIPTGINATSQAILFGDTVSTKSTYGIDIGNGLYETAPVDETKSIVSMPRGYSITKLCVGQSPSVCTSAPSSYVTISFTRPSPLPNIYLNGSQTVNYSRACVEMQSPRAPATGHIRSVEVFNSGMIRSNTTGCI
jgi:type II secretory pathway pseudopilin PulG